MKYGTNEPTYLWSLTDCLAIAGTLAHPLKTYPKPKKGIPFPLKIPIPRPVTESVPTAPYRE